MWNRAVATVWCTFCGPHLPKVSRSFSLFCDFYVKLSSCYSLVHIFQKCSAHLSPLAFWSAKRALATVLCAFRRQLLQFEPRTCGNRDPPLATTEVILPEKNIGFRARECFHPWIRARLNCYTSQLDDGWFTWWCGWHDDANADHDNRPWPGSLLTKLPLVIWYYNILYVFYEILCVNVAKEC